MYNSKDMTSNWEQIRAELKEHFARKRETKYEFCKRTEATGKRMQWVTIAKFIEGKNVTMRSVVRIADALKTRTK